MGFIDEMDNVQEPDLAPEGTHHVRCFKAEAKRFESGRMGGTLMLSIEDGDGVDYAPIFHNVLFPTDEEVLALKNGSKDKEASNAKRFILDYKRILAAFNMDAPDSDDFPSEDFVGQEADLLIGMDEYKGEVKNIIKLPRLKD